MKKICLAVLGALALSGCQATQWVSDNVMPKPYTDEERTHSMDEGLALYALNAPVNLPTPTSTDSSLSPQQQADLWDRMRLQMSIDVPLNERVQTHIDWYTRHSSYIDRISQQAAPFLYLIIERIEERGLPVELALVPVVESSYDTFAYSHGSASGIWQFIPSTATYYGLDINWWYDGRRDIIAATDTALDYLERLHRTFDGDWLHAMAAYNAGQGRVAGAIRRNKNAGLDTDFWSLNLPRETQNYVPKILALAELLRDSQNYGVDWRYVANQPVTAVIELENQIDLAQAAEMAGMTLHELHRFNSGYNRWATGPDGPHRLLLPVANAEQFNVALAQTSPEQWMNWQRHQVQSGESLIRIANQYGTTARAIQLANELDGHVIRQGDHLLIPVASLDLEEYTLSAEQRRVSTQNRSRGNHRINHQVASGDTLWDLSRKYSVPVRSLASWNNMAPGDFLRPGQTLTIWRQERPSNAGDGAVVRAVYYQVRSGDSLDRIANRFSVSIADIERWNEINRQRFLQPGQRLTLYVDVTRVNI
ncbi:lytic transglycosylase [Aliidiomarina sedimenti]|uniref:Lytic transglycosylase n=1 Tax=Aliidiomarina sedimenti TaxID=1933879 RepID=A0ABY0BWV8_9GAMM|nr:LysM peptidoglycan-binding domain-containing protein [Aliidiomarina sedimenti]RUO28829.1 lytic transglycosylase [Aliidiomarina sedimenti]